MVKDKPFLGLLLNPKTLAQAENFARQPAPSLIVTGRAGSGKYTLARAISATILGARISDLEKSSNYRLISLSEKQSEISIDSIRQMRRAMNLKQAGRGERRVVVVDQADRLSLEAQNAMLKTLEEPPESTHFILTAPTSSSVLPTIASRSWEIFVHDVGKREAENFYGTSHTPEKLGHAWHLSQGQPGLMNSLLDDEDNHPLTYGVDLAKRFLSSDRYERLLIADKLGTNRADMDNFLDALSRLLQVLHHQAVIKHAPNQQKLLKARQTVKQLSLKHSAKANGRLLVLNLALALKI